MCVWHIIYLVYPYWMCIWVYRRLTINSATPRGPRPAGREPWNRTGLWLMMMRRAWGTSAGLPLLLPSWPSDFLSETLHSAVFTKNIFCINFNKLVVTFHSGNFFVLKKKKVNCFLNGHLCNWKKIHFKFKMHQFSYRSQYYFIP